MKNLMQFQYLAYDAIGINLSTVGMSNNFQFKKEQLYNKKGFVGLHGEFHIRGIIKVNKN